MKCSIEELDVVERIWLFNNRLRNKVLVIFHVERDANDPNSETILVFDLHPVVGVVIGIVVVKKIPNFSLNVHPSFALLYSLENALFLAPRINVLVREQLGRVDALIVIIGEEDLDAVTVDVLFRAQAQH